MSNLINDKNIQAFLNKICEQIKAKEVHHEIRLEMENHLLDIIEEKIEEGATEKEAIQHAIHQMGDPVIVGKQLHQVHRPKIDWGLISVITIFIGIGLLAIYALQLTEYYLDKNRFEIKISFTCIGLLLMIGLYFFDYRKLKQISWPTFFLTIWLMVVTISLGGKINAHPYLDTNSGYFGLVGEYPYLLLLLFIGIFFSRRWRTLNLFMKAVLFLAIPCFLCIGHSLFNELIHGVPYRKLSSIYIDFISVSPDLLLFSVAGIIFSRRWDTFGVLTKTVLFIIIPDLLYIIANSYFALLIYNLSFFTVVFLSRVGRKELRWYLSLILCIFICTVIFLIIRYDKDFIGFINPYADPLDSGYIYIQISNLLHAAGLWGQGFVSAFKTIPILDDFFIFVYLIYSFGWVLGIIFVILIAFFVLRITRMIKRVNDFYGKRIITSFLMIFSLTFMGNILMSAGLLPILFNDPIPLPFINDIGIHLIYKFIDLGIIISVYRHKDLISTQAQVK